MAAKAKEYRMLKFVLYAWFFLGQFSLFSQTELRKELILKELKEVDQSDRSNRNFNKAFDFFFEKNYDSTLVYTYQYLNSSGRNKVLEWHCRYFRAVSFMQKELHKKALLELNKIPSDYSLYSLVQLQSGTILLDLGEYRKALTYFHALEKSKAKDKATIRTSINLHNIGICYLHLGEFNLAEKYLFESTRLQEEEKDTLMLVSSYMDLANLYYEQYRDAEAIPYFLKAYSLSKSTDNFELKQNAALNMAVVEENRKDFHAALEYRKEAGVWKDSLNDQNKIWDIAELEKRYQAEQNRKQVDFLEQENARKSAERNTFILASILLFVALGAGFYFYRQKVRTNKIILRQKAELDILNSTKDQLFSIVSHDLRSSVNALRSSNAKLFEHLETENYTGLYDILKSNGSIANGTYSLLDNLLNWAMLQTQQLYFHTEDLQLRSVVDQVAFNYLPMIEAKGLCFENQVEPGICVHADLDSLKLILRNLLDNAIKFSGTEGRINVFSKEHNPAFISLSVKDEGSGMEETTRTALMQEDESLARMGNSEIIGNGLGLQLCKSMIQKNGGKLQIESQVGKGTTMHILLLKAKINGSN